MESPGCGRREQSEYPNLSKRNDDSEGISTAGIHPGFFLTPPTPATIGIGNFNKKTSEKLQRNIESNVVQGMCTFVMPLRVQSICKVVQRRSTLWMISSEHALTDIQGLNTAQRFWPCNRQVNEPWKGHLSLLMGREIPASDDALLAKIFPACDRAQHSCPVQLHTPSGDPDSAERKPMPWKSAVLPKRSPPEEKTKQRNENTRQEGRV